LRFLYESQLIHRYDTIRTDDEQRPVKDPPVVSLARARLEGVDLQRAILRDANLSEAWLNKAKFEGADLMGADLTGADLTDAKGVTNEQLDRQAYSLKGATMPNGQKYEDWLKDKQKRGEYLTGR
jgi:hypothetical protein